MRTWMTSLQAAVLFSVIAMLSFLGYALLVYRYLIEELMPGIPGAVVQTLFVLLLVGVWIWSLFDAIRGSRRGLVVALVCTALPAAFTLYDLIYYSPVPYGWPLLQIFVWTTFILSLGAIVALVVRLLSFRSTG